MVELLELLDEAIDHARRRAEGAAWDSEEVVQLHRLEEVRRMVVDGVK